MIARFGSCRLTEGTTAARMARRNFGNLPRDNRRQNKQVSDAAGDEGLNDEQRRRLGKIVEADRRQHGIDHDYHSIRRVAKELKQGKL